MTGNAAMVRQIVHDAICDALPEWIKWTRLPRWRGDYAEAHAKVATRAVLDALERAHYEVRYVGPGDERPFRPVGSDPEDWGRYNYV